MKRTLVAAVIGIAIASAASPTTASAYDDHLCGVYGTDLGPQESCPGISPRHSWKRVTAYRNSGSGIDMCAVIRNSNNTYMFSRCYFYATTILLGPSDMNNGNQLTRAYNKNNNAAIGTERRYLYANTN